MSFTVVVVVLVPPIVKEVVVVLVPPIVKAVVVVVTIKATVIHISSSSNSGNSKSTGANKMVLVPVFTVI